MGGGLGRKASRGTDRAVVSLAQLRAHGPRQLAVLPQPLLGLFRVPKDPPTAWSSRGRRAPAAEALRRRHAGILDLAIHPRRMGRLRAEPGCWCAWVAPPHPAL